MKALAPFFVLVVAVAVTVYNIEAQDAPSAQTAGASTPSFDDHLARANALFKAGKLDEAQAVAQAAAQLDPKRFEAPAALALILHEANKPDDARAALDAAAKLTPLDKQEQLQRLAQLLGAKPAPTPANPAELTGAARRKYDTLLVIIEEAEKAGQDAERKKLLREFLDRSEPFLKEYQDQLALWATRAVAGVELNLPKAGWLAGVQLVRLGAESSKDPKLRKVMATLDRKGWLTADPPTGCLSEFSYSEVRKLAEGGSAAAQAELGVRLDNGIRGSPSNVVEAVAWYRKAAEQGNPLAQSNLGYAYRNGLGGLPKDQDEETRWAKNSWEGYMKAAERGDVVAQRHVAFYFEHGQEKVIAKDLEQAAHWYKMAAEQGDTQSQMTLGGLFDKGPSSGGLGDPSEAIKWYRMAAESGDPSAQLSMGWAYRDGKGVDIDLAEAVKWYRKSAERGHYLAHVSLAGAYAKGNGVPRDHSEAVKWYRSALAALDRENAHRSVIHQRDPKWENSRVSSILTPLVRLLSRSPDPGARDGKEAVRLAHILCEHENYNESMSLGLLATACAEAGDFQQAIKYCEKAMALNKYGGRFERLVLDELRLGRPIREDYKFFY